MARRCEICDKGPVVGRTVSHAHNVGPRRFEVNLQTVRAVAHSLKSSCGNIGAHRLMRLAQQLERACDDGALPQAQSLAEELARVYPQAVEALQQEARGEVA